jgi:DNA repair exonuclease SbcCD ATPase subunit
MIRKFNHEVQEVGDRQDELETLHDQIGYRTDEIESDIPLAQRQLEQAKEVYDNTKDPVEKRRYAIKLITRKRFVDYLHNSLESLNDAVVKVENAVEDAQLVYDLARNRAKDAEIYFKLNGGLRLVGQALVSARTHTQLPEVELEKFEFTLSKVEEEITQIPSEDLLLEATNVSQSIKQLKG